jgi:hypothetical protein
LQQPHRQQDEERELEVLRLPVLHHGDGERRGEDVAPEADLRLHVAVLLVVEGGVARHRLEHERDRKERQEDDRETVLAQEAAHGH